jgi:UDP-2,3-diacylglucosamine pyrophosphatase LpxH
MANVLFPMPADTLPQFDELYVVSDLHLGGPAGFQIFNSGAELTRLIEHLRIVSPEKKIALLINGDFVDFLAELPSLHFDPAGAIGKLDRIATKDPSFTSIFTALKKFANTKNRRLIVNLGNHDLELALPWVRTRLLEILSGGNEAAIGRITCSFEGTGFSCRVGTAPVLCVHGNEVDTWNVADYETIRRFGREVIQGRPIDSWIPNAGSRLVIEVMNDLKRKYPFVDLLKPETQAAVPTLLALAPDQRDKLGAISGTLRRLVWDKVKRATGFLGADPHELNGRTVAVADILAPGLTDLSPYNSSSFDRAEYAARLLEDVEDNFGKGVSPMSLVGSDNAERYLGLPSALMKLVTGEDTCEVLREALSDLHKDRSFDPTEEDTTFKLLDEQIGDGFDFLISGHTHLARALTRKQKGGWYFNSGTWARLIKLEEKTLKSASEFRKVFDAFKVGTIAALDAFPELITRRLSVVVVRSDDKRTHGELRQVNLSSTGDVLPAETNYRFTKG